MLAANLVLTNPALLIGAAAAALPIIIHLLLRPRPRRTRFPAIVLLHAAVSSGQRASRLRNALLMATRALLVALAALLLAGPTCVPAGSDFVGSQPIACAILLDDSASTSYALTNDTTIFDAALTQARAFIASSTAWPEGSALLVLRAKASGDEPTWSADRTELADALTAGEPAGRHARPLGGATSEAARLLRAAEQPARRLVVFTDGAAHAWRDVTPAALDGFDDLAVRVVVADSSARSNIALLDATGPEQPHPAGAPVTLTANLRADGVDAKCWLAVHRGGDMLQRVGPLEVSADTALWVDMPLDAAEAGANAITLQLEPTDRMDFDQRRSLVFETAPRPIVWLIAPRQNDLSALIVRNLLAPEALAPEQQLVRLLTLAPDEVPATAEQRPALIVVLSGSQFAPATMQTLLSHVRRGSIALLIPGAADENVDWPELRSLLTATESTVEHMDTVAALHWESNSRYAADEELAELSRCAVRIRVALGELFDDVSVEARYSDGLPVIVSKDIGAGRLLMLTTSPAPQWSSLGIRAAGLMTWVHRLVDEATGPPTATAAFTLGEQVRHRFSVLPAAGLVRVSFETETDAPPTWMRMIDGLPQTPWPTDRAGVYRIAAAGKGTPTATYVVNWPAEESRLEQIELPQLQKLLGRDGVSLVTPGAGAQEAPSSLAERVFTTRDLTKPLAAILLAAVALELFLAVQRPRKRP